MASCDDSRDQIAEDLISEILVKLVEEDKKSDVETFLRTLKVCRDQQKQVENAERWLQWASGQKKLKIVSYPVPPGVLPKGCDSGELLDIKVSSRGPDDAVYDASQQIRQRVARGNCFLRIDKGLYKGSRLILFGLKKFTGGLGDDDDRDKGDNYTWQKYFTKPLEMATHVVATRKANGEAAHLSCIEIGGQLLICAGSKNVHMLFSTREDIKRYRGDRFRIASEICEVVMDILEQMEPKDRDRLLKFLATTGFTAIFEILSPDHQHVEDLSYLCGNKLQFITWTSPDLNSESEAQLCTVPPHVGIEIARVLGLQTIEYTVIPLSEVDSHITRIRQGYQFEGEVLYFLENSSTVIGLLKKKTIWYIICRAIREKVRVAAAAALKNGSTFSVSSFVKKTEKRLNEIQTWLNLDDENIAAWKDLGIGFLKWAVSGVQSHSIDHHAIGDKFPVLWKQYLEESGKCDKMKVKYEEPTTTYAIP
ncbi:uncharacterized protein LOC112576733 [Pomacea canaliculata]|uniref:uncharacterized protein LOC112576733 n=1 Tax=Pomacea canaliculata TaxID=400727 RepID=UPI000D72A516|nr:uncharacterized protein LOC112576733 [Pomacea canaliculata]